jgi:hypothetical protein
MKLSKFSKLATVSAFALLLASSANAATVQNGGNIQINVTATVTNSFDVTTTDLAWDSIDVRGSTGTQASADLNPTTDAITDDDQGAGNSKIAANVGNAAAAALVTATLLPNTTLITVSYNTVSDLDETADSGSQFDVALLDNLDAPVLGTAGTAGSYPYGGPAVAGNATTTANGELTFNIGGSIRTQSGDNYDPGAYDGTFNVTLSY